MTTAIAKIHISLTEGILQLEGSETFVAQQIALLEPHIIKAFENKGALQQKNANPHSPPTKPIQTNNLDQFDNLFAENGGEIQLLKDIPGSNNAQKTINAALLLTYANELAGNGTSLPSEVIRKICKAHACLDPSNFSTSLKSTKEYFLLEGETGKPKSIRLTIPGKKRAIELAKQLNAS